MSEVLCDRCDKPIPPGRLEALPDTRVCVECSKEMGGEFDLYSTTESLGKAGSLKKNYGSVSIKKVRKPIEKKGDKSWEVFSHGTEEGPFREKTWKQPRVTYEQHLIAYGW